MKKAVRLLTLIIVLLGAYWTSPSGMWAQTRNRAAIVVRFSEERSETACVEFEEPQITGFDLLQRSNLDIEIEAQGLGALVCSIDSTGCPASDCLCQCRGGGECIYWSYWHLQNDGWQYSQAGSISYQIQPGAVDGWSWGPGAVNQAFPPPEVSFEEVCVDLATDTPTPSPSPTNTNTPEVIVVTPMATNTPSRGAADPIVAATNTSIPTSSATKIPSATATRNVSARATDTPQPVQQATVTPTDELRLTQNQEVLPEIVNTVTLLPTTESVAIVNFEEDPLSGSPTAVSLSATSKPIAAAVLQNVDAGTEEPPVAQPIQQAVMVINEPTPQLQVIGSGVVPKTESLAEQSELTNNGLDNESRAGLFPFIIFLLIMIGLGTLLFVVSRRRKTQELF